MPTKPGCNISGPSQAAPTPSRKLIYVRKVKVGEEVFIVGSDFFLATPIWLRV